MQSRRAYTRVSFSDPVRVHLPSRETVVSTLASNLSRGGIFLRSDRPFLQGQTLSLEFNTFMGPVVVSEGEVTWTKIRPPIEPGGVGAVPGMGIRFVKMPEESRSRIGHFVDEMIRQQQVRIEKKRTGYKTHSPSLADIVEDRNEARRLSSAYIIVSRSVKEAIPGPADENTAAPAPAVRATPLHFTRLLLILNGAVLSLIAVALAILLLSGPATAPPPGESPGALETPEPGSAAGPTPAKQPAPAPQGESPRVGPPVFAETSGGWIMTLQASAPADIYHFTLDDPPSLVVLFRKTTYTGGKNPIQPRIPVVAGVHVQDQLGYTRFTIDFAGWTIPGHTIVKSESSAEIFFSMDTAK
jgi:hypothetical protein